MAFDISQFRAEISKREGFAKAAFFRATIAPFSQNINSQLYPTLGNANVNRDMTFLCESTELPGRGFQTLEIGYYGPPINTPSVTTWNDLNLTFICPNDMSVKRYFDEWMEMINPKPGYDQEFRNNYETTISVFQYNDAGSVTYAVQFSRAYPVNMGNMAVAWSEENFHRVPIQFSFAEWRPLTINLGA